MAAKFHLAEDGIIRGVCDKHGDFIGDAIGCPYCFQDDEDEQARRETEWIAEQQRMEEERGKDTV